MKKLITENDVTFENDVQDSNVHWQEIYAFGNYIGAIGMREGSFLEPIYEWYQCLVSDKCVPELNRYYESETKGYVFATFSTLQEFLNFINQK
jgi:hypothetical protein